VDERQSKGVSETVQVVDSRPAAGLGAPANGSPAGVEYHPPQDASGGASRGAEPEATKRVRGDGDGEAAADRATPPQDAEGASAPVQACAEVSPPHWPLKLSCELPDGHAGKHRDPLKGQPWFAGLVVPTEPRSGSTAAALEPPAQPSPPPPVEVSGPPACEAPSGPPYHAQCSKPEGHDGLHTRGSLAWKTETSSHAGCARYDGPNGGLRGLCAKHAGGRFAAGAQECSAVLSPGAEPERAPRPSAEPRLVTAGAQLVAAAHLEWEIKERRRLTSALTDAAVELALASTALSIVSSALEAANAPESATAHEAARRAEASARAALKSKDEQP
jgi:hypothetical protein